MKWRTLLHLAALMAATFLFASGTAWADPPGGLDGTTIITVSPSSPVPLVAGDDATLTSTTTAPAHPNPPPTTATLISQGKVIFQLATDGAGTLNPVPFAAVVFWHDLNGPGQNPDAGGQTTLDVDLDGTLKFVPGTVGGFRAHYITGGGAHKVGNNFSDPVNVTAADAGDPFPDGTITYTQGFYGASPIGELVVPALINNQSICEDILDALTGVDTPVFDCTTISGRADLAEFLTGELDTAEGLEDPEGFLPAGFVPGQNLAAQTITLLLNLNLAAVLGTGEFPIYEDYAINIDPVTDVPSGITYDPVFINQGELADTCLDGDADQICDPGFVLSDLGLLVAALDEAVGGTLAEGTTVGEILDAALTLLTSGTDPQDVNGVDLTAGDLTAIIGLINESYDDGVINGFVTAFDID